MTRTVSHQQLDAHTCVCGARFRSPAKLRRHLKRKDPTDMPHSGKKD
jgi:hypothetical protein